MASTHAEQSSSVHPQTRHAGGGRPVVTDVAGKASAGIGILLPTHTTPPLSSHGESLAVRHRPDWRSPCRPPETSFPSLVVLVVGVAQTAAAGHHRSLLPLSGPNRIPYHRGLRRSRGHRLEPREDPVVAQAVAVTVELHHVDHAEPSLPEPDNRPAGTETSDPGRQGGIGRIQALRRRPPR